MLQHTTLHTKALLCLLRPLYQRPGYFYLEIGFFGGRILQRGLLVMRDPLEQSYCSNLSDFRESTSCREAIIFIHGLKV